MIFPGGVKQRPLILSFVMAIVILRACFIKLKRVVESENRYRHGRTVRIGCAGLVFHISIKESLVLSLEGLNPPKSSPLWRQAEKAARIPCQW